ncbi:Potassium transporter KimA [Methanosarcinaceae archaeon Ag5]|uniref:Potassium transporter KimA n=1 Tax=Methanolapillus africanus TaxID=3028297 RepID=A0AAE4MJG5_9EURY|nr:Potassium transporter KimA [Methanosarcinaceae archaeon Ag5]
MPDQEKHFKMKDLLLGKALKNDEIKDEKLNLKWGLPIMASDAVSSVAYAIEEILLVLVPVLGLLSVHYLGIVALPIIILLIVLVFSYSQIIDHYPNGGGSYVVSKGNLGKKASLIAAAALIIDYIMTVAVSISSATAACVAAVPGLLGYQVPIALIFLSLVTLMNLRGVKESAKVFGLPTYGFILVMAALITIGLAKFLTGTLMPIEYAPSVLNSLPTSPAGALTTIAMVFLMLRAFSSGCSALTGVEAVSNAVPSFKQPSQKIAKHILYCLAGIIIFIFGGSVLLATQLGVIPVDGHTVLSQMGAAVFGTGPMYYILQFMTAAILLLAANTAYNGLPTLLAILAVDNYMPHRMAQRGQKLSFSNGILFIFFAAGGLIFLFNAETHKLIPLYAVGVFLSFTLAQTGMVVKWMKDKEPGWKHKMLINAFGAAMSLIGVIIVFTTKFTAGAWMLAIAIPVLVLLMQSIQKHYQSVADDIVLKPAEAREIYKPCSSQDNNPCIVLGSSFSRPFLKALNYANVVSRNVTVLHISTSDAGRESFEKLWREAAFPEQLVIIDAPYRDILPPLEDYIDKKQSELVNDEFLTVVFVKFISNQVIMDNILHGQAAYFIENRLKKYNKVASFVIHYTYNRKGRNERNKMKDKSGF